MDQNLIGDGSGFGTPTKKNYGILMLILANLEVMRVTTFLNEGKFPLVRGNTRIFSQE
jgi:hypothetical protein